MQLFFWCTLLVIGVFDAREYRIPNYLVIILFFLNFFSLLIRYFNKDVENVFIINSCLGLFVFFVVGMILYFGKVLASGDVKLLSVIGFFVGIKGFFDTFLCIALSCIFVGTMYLLLNRNSYVSLHFSLISNGDYNRFINSELDSRHITKMPFAPILVIALAMYQYFQH
ncbi:prepilin peptidase [Vibrio diazotrophicus]|uniref:prepilin peptidase n=1 Tax=Vibrio diazotrophicus TaxID=685 RepID=UPI0005AA4750|nr:A24 family peptidase [Vibrio diazotrophicus]